jgi:molybdopterin-guanine dinucleotide biosynthesis protein B
VLVASGRRWALMHEVRDDAEPALGDLLKRLSAVDLVLIEGFKHDPHPKIEVHRAANGKKLLYPDDPAILAIASDIPLPETTLPVMNLNDAAAIASFAAAHATLW